MTCANRPRSGEDQGRPNDGFDVTFEHLILEEAQRVFPNACLANDLDTIAV